MKIPFSPPVRHLLPLAALGGLLASAGSTFAVDKYWANSRSDFGDGSNWVGGFPGTADRGFFTAAIINPVLSGPISVSGLSFFTPGITISGSAAAPLTLLSTTTNNDLAAALYAAAPGVTTVSAPVVLGAAANTSAFNSVLGAELIVSGDISGARGLTKGGFGIVTLSGNNSFAGGVSVTGANGNFGLTRLNINSDTALGTGTLTTGTGNGGVTLGNSSGSAHTLANAFNIGAGSGVTTIFDLPASGAGDLTFTGQATMNGAAAAVGTVAVLGGTLSLKGGLSEAAAGEGLAKNGSGTLSIAGPVGITGLITFNGGGFVLDGGTIANAAQGLALTNTNFTYKGTATGTSAQTLGAANFTGRTGITVNGGTGTGTTLTVGNTWTRAAGSTLAINLTGAATLTSTPAVSAGGLVVGTGTAAFATVNDGTGIGFATLFGSNVTRYTGATTLQETDSSATTNFVTKVGDPAYQGGTTLTLAAGTRSFNTLQIDTSGGAGTLDLNGFGLTLSDRAILVTGANGYTIQNGALGAAGAELVVHQFSAGALTIAGTIGTNSNASLTKDGPGALVLAGSNLYTGATIANEGTINITGSVKGAITATGSTVATSGTINLQSPSATTSGAVLAAGAGTINATVANAISGTASVSVNGFLNGPTINLSKANNYTGTTTLTAGMLNLGDPAANGTGTLNLNGGILNNTSGAAMTLANNNAIVIGGGFIFTGSNSLNLGTGGVTITANRNIDVAQNTLTLGGVVSGAGGLTKIGPGTLALNSANAFTAATIIQGGVLLLNDAAALPGGNGVTGGTSNLTLSGGVLGLGAGDFTRPVGTNPTDVQWTTTGGFAAFGANRIVNLGGLGSPQVWNTANFLVNSVGAVLVLGAPNADATVDFQNPIVLGTTGTNTRMVQVDNGSAVVDGRLSGGLTSTGGTQSFAKGGLGTLDLAGTNSYSGATIVSSGTLLLTGTISGTSQMTVAGGAVLSGNGLIQTAPAGGVTLLNGAMLAPGSGGVGTLTADMPFGLFDIGAATTGNPGEFKFELGPATGDLVQLVNGQLSIGSGTLNFNDFSFSTIGGIAPGTYTLFDSNQPVIGSLGANLSGSIGGFAANLALSSDGQDVVLSVVPEPASAGLLLAASGLILMRRRSRRV